MTGSRPSRGLVIGVLLTTACLPIRITYLDSPTLDGSYRTAAGTPIRGAQVLVSARYSDTTCAAPAARAITDSNGAFHLPQTKHTERFLILLPIDRIASYRICVTSHDTLRTAYRTASLGMAAPSQPLECFEWMSGSGARATCVEEGTWGVVSGGRWVSGDTTGYYRLVTQYDPRNGARVFVLAQWIAGPRGRPTGPIVQTVDLSAVTTKLFSMAQPELVPDGDRWRVLLKGATRPDGHLVHDVLFALGPPGDVRLVSIECRSSALRDLWYVERVCK